MDRANLMGLIQALIPDTCVLENREQIKKINAEIKQSNPKTNKALFLRAKSVRK
jgi:hypothetical protein